MSGLDVLLERVRGCELCLEHLPLGPQPLLKASRRVEILVIGQAPGRRAHESGVPWDDPSGDRLRDWLGVTRDAFYDDPRLGLMPMGFCYPGTGAGGDLAPRPECMEAWHEELLSEMPRLALTLLVGKYAQSAYLPYGSKLSVTEAVRSWKRTLPRLLVLPHPSPRNNRWLKSNPWFESDVLPDLRGRVRRALQ